MNLNKKEKSAARKRAFRNSQTDEAKADASAQLQARMFALRTSPGDQRTQIARDFNAKNRHSEINPFFLLEWAVCLRLE
jgi:hypothetical protein